MSLFSNLFQTGVWFGQNTITDVLADYGQSILGGGVFTVPRERGGQSPEPIPKPPIDFGIPEFPVAVLPQTYLPEPSPDVYPVYAEPVGGGGDYPPPPDAWDPPTEEEQELGGYTIVETPEGDFAIPSDFGVAVFPHDLDTKPPEEEEMAHDWAHTLRQGLGAWMGGGGGSEFNEMGPAFAAAGTDVTRPSGRAALPPSAAPLVYQGVSQDCGNRRYVTLDRQTGKISCRRRRRRRLLTNRDLADLASLKTITGGGAALNSAVIRAVR